LLEGAIYLNMDGVVLGSGNKPPRVSKDKQEKVAAAPRAVREIAWKAQSRLNRRYRALIRRGKLKTVAITAVAREFAGFIWAVARAATAARAAAK
jgi:transposase